MVDARFGMDKGQNTIPEKRQITFEFAAVPDAALDVVLPGVPEVLCKGRKLFSAILGEMLFCAS